MINFQKEEKEFESIAARFEENLKKIRTGRASTIILEGILVNVYGTDTPLLHTAALSSPDPRTVVVRPWDKNLLPAVEQAIAKSSLGFSLISEKDQLRVIFPALTEERRKEFAKIIGRQAEEARIEIRKRRDEIWKTIQEEEREGLVSETQKYSQKEQMEKLVCEFNKQIEEAAKKKEKEVMEI